MLISVFLAFLLVSTGSAAEKEFRGAVTDDMCGAKHMMEGMDDKECADECVKMGAAYALYVPGEDKMYLADDPSKLEPYAGENVVVVGSVRADGKTIDVKSVKKADES